MPPCFHPLFSLQVQSYKRKVRQLEDDLLFRLSNSQGNLLDDTELIDILAVTKQTAQVRRLVGFLLSCLSVLRSVLLPCFLSSC